MLTAQEIVAAMNVGEAARDIQHSQTSFRLRLVNDWQIEKGARVLEIGCGQGDMTAVLAAAVGSKGQVLAVDIAHPSYGAPSTLGESAERIKSGPLGDQIKFKFEFDVLDPSNAFQQNAFDYTVLALSTWYFDSLDTLRKTLSTVRPWTNRLCLSEWDLEPTEIGQLGHMLSVLIQGQVEAFKSESKANVRTPYSREALKAILEETGWRLKSERLIDTTGMADGRWEISACLANSLTEADELQMPPKMRALIHSFLDVLKRTKDLPLPAYSIVAERED